MKALITILVVFLAASSLSAQQATAGKEAAVSLPEKEKDLTDSPQTATVVFGTLGLVVAAAAAPYAISTGGSTRIGPFNTPYWALDGALALIAIAALNHTYNEIYHIDPDRSLISILGIAILRY